ncbi:MAG: exonuclease, partial [Nitrospirae bacterium]|nr:exonuclease [Nitrospirota bacterium]
MIRHTFTLLDGIGEKTEKRLWQSGLVTWNDFIETDYLPCFSPFRAEFYRELLLGFKYELDSGNSSVFKECLNSGEHWRLFDQFRESAICLDIETNGYAPGRGGEITIIGLYNGQDYEVLISGENLDKDYL